MLRNDAPRPSFLVSEVLRTCGSGRPAEPSYVGLPATLRVVVPDSGVVEQGGRRSTL